MGTVSIGRNHPCPCGSGKKSKKCCGDAAVLAAAGAAPSAAGFNERGNFLADRGRHAEAMLCYRKALEMDPGFAGAWSNLGIACKDQGMFDQAVSFYRRAIELQPDFAAAWNNLGIALKELGRRDEAVQCYRRALELSSGSVRVVVNLANLLYDLDRYYEAVPLLQAAVEAEADFVTVYRLAFALRATGNNDASLVRCRQALTMAPESAPVLINMASAYHGQGRVDQALECYRTALTAAPDFTDTFCGYLMTLQYDPSTSAGELLAEARRFGAVLKGTRPRQLREVAISPRPGKGEGLRVGFVSADLRNHPVGYFLEGVLGHLGSDTLRLFAYANHPLRDELSERIRPRFEKWADVSGMSDEELAQRIRSDRIDLLIDLSGHSNGNRLCTFALKPAPVQATWLGSAATTGLEEMDFILADPVTVPVGEEEFYTEKVWRLPETYVCFTAPRLELPVSALPALEKGHVTFGCFNYPGKINDAVVDLWSEILARRAGVGAPSEVQELRPRGGAGAFPPPLPRPGPRPGAAAFSRSLSPRGVPDRLRGGRPLPRPVSLPGAHHHLRGALDGGAHPDPLHAARDVRPKRRAGAEVGRPGAMGGKIRRGVPEKAVTLAADLRGLAALRQGLRQTFLSSPLCAADRFAGHLEEAFRGMVRA